MELRGYGRVLNVSSEYGSFGSGLGGPAAYATAKAALHAITVKAAREARGDVKINAACPGWVATDMGGAGAPVTPEEAAAGLAPLLSLPAEGPSGLLFDRRSARLPW